MQTLENLLLQNYRTEYLDITHKYSFVILVCSNGITKDNLYTENLKQTFENLLL